jgi:hypothetical protein
MSVAHVRSIRTCLRVTGKPFARNLNFVALEENPILSEFGQKIPNQTSARSF